MRHTLDNTWLDPEEYAYPHGSLRQSSRKAFVRCPDGINRTVTVGIPDTWFSIPARVQVKGKTITGYVTTDDNVFEFIPYLYGKNNHVF